MSVNITKIKSLNVIYASTQEELGPAVVDAIGAGVSLQDAALAGVDFNGLDLTGGDFQRADLTGAILSGANLTDADFRFADLSGADFTDAVVTRADFRHATLNNVITTGTDFSTATLQGAAIVAADGALGIGVAPVVASISRVLYVNPDVPTGNTVGNTATETAFESSCTIPAGTLQVGDMLRVTARLTYVTDGVELVLRLKLGADTMSTILVTDSSGEFVSAYVNAHLLVLALGVNGEILPSHSAVFMNGGVATHGGTVEEAPSPLDTTEPVVLTITADKSAATAGNDVVLRMLAVEILRAN